ncbi:MAG: CoA pyrophosphatase [Woeseiaceae bacterium]
MADSPTSIDITADRVKRSLAGTAVPGNPLDVVAYPGSEHWPASLRQQLAGTLTPAGVLIPIFDREDQGLSVLLTKRSAELKHHAGQISFPGGRMEPDDVDIAATALRETHEEVGILSDDVSVVGFLQPMPTITGYAVTPVVGLVDASVSVEVDRHEVEFSFEVPLRFLLDGSNRRVVQRELHGKSFPMAEFRYDGHRIWGATAMMIIQFIKILNNNKL